LRAIISNAPIGIAVTDSNMFILSANASFCKILGYSQDELLKLTFKDFTHPDDVKESIVLLRELISGRIAFFSQEKRYIRRDGKIIYGKITVSTIRDNENKPVLFIAELEDITERKKADAENEMVIEFLRIANTSTTTRNLVKTTVDFLQKQSGCEAVGIRLKVGEDYPYYETKGFPPEHVRIENTLCARDEAGCVIRDFKGDPVIECMCGNVICGRFDISKEFFTEKRKLLDKQYHTTSCHYS
jgi:PAS domain S-box-containing protein